MNEVAIGPGATAFTRILRWDELDRERLRQHLHPALRRVVVHLRMPGRRDDHLGLDRRHVHDRAAARVADRRRERPGHDVHALEVRVEHEVPLVLVEVVERRHAHEPRVVHEVVDRCRSASSAASRAASACAGSRTSSSIATGPGHRPPRSRPPSRRAASRRTSATATAAPSLASRERDRPPDARARAGHERHTAGVVEAHVVLRALRRRPPTPTSTAMPPPSASSVVPVTYEDSSLARNRRARRDLVGLGRARAAAGEPRRRAGTRRRATMPRSAASSSIASSPIGVRTHPGQSAFARTPRRPAVDRDRLRETDQRGLRGDVGGARRRGDEARDRRDQHDRAAASGFQVRHRRAHEVQGTREVDVDRGAPGLVGHVAGRAAEADAARSRPRRRGRRRPRTVAADRRVGVRGVARVARHREHRRPRRRRPRRLRAPSGHDDPRAFRREPPRDGRADARAAAADHRHLAVEPHRVLPSVAGSVTHRNRTERPEARVANMRPLPTRGSPGARSRCSPTTTRRSASCRTRCSRWRAGPEILEAFSELITQIWNTGTLPKELKPLIAHRLQRGGRVPLLPGARGGRRARARGRRREDRRDLELRAQPPSTPTPSGRRCDSRATRRWCRTR